MKTYDPTWLVGLARNQFPDEPWLAEALRNCTVIFKESPIYIYFVDPSSPNKLGSDWQFEDNIILVHPEEGDIVLDVLKDKRIGGIEFLDKV